MSLLFFFFSCISLEELSSHVDLQVQTWCAPSRTEYVARVYDGDTIFLEPEEEAADLFGPDADPAVEAKAGSKGSTEPVGSERWVRFLLPIPGSSLPGLQICTEGGRGTHPPRTKQ